MTTFAPRGLRRATPMVATVLALLGASPARAQRAEGTVREGGSGRAVAGAIVSVLDSAGVVLARALTGENGAYAVAMPAGARTARVVRIGFRPRDVDVTAVPEGTLQLDISLTMIPTLLEPARVRALGCPRRGDAEQAYGLWDQARAGLLAGVVAREQNPAAMVRIAFRQTLSADQRGIERQVVTVDTTERTLNSYRAVFDAAAFLDRGFAEDSAGLRLFAAPDAEVLLDPAFGNGYCFRIASPERSRPTQVGLGFAPADRKTGRVDISGVLWVDTVARAIRDIQYDYVNVDARSERLRAGGNVSFLDLPNGVVFVNRWMLRLAGAVPERAWVRNRQVTRMRDAVSVSGGEIAHAVWEDGTRYDAPLPGLAADVTNGDGGRAAGREVVLVGSTYAGIVDSTGRLTVADVFAGRYPVAVREPGLRIIGLDSIPTNDTISVAPAAARRVTLVLPTVEDWVRSLCRGGGPILQTNRRRTTDRTLVIVRVLGPGDVPIPGVDVGFSIPSPSTPSGWVAAGRTVRTGLSGIAQLCTDIVDPGARIAVTLTRGREEIGRIEQTLELETVTAIPIHLKP